MNPHLAHFTASSIFTSSNIILGLFPPSSRAISFTVSLDASMICFPVSVPPVMAAISTRGLFTIASPTTEPEPATILTTPLGKPASSNTSARSIILRDAQEEGLTTAVFPAARIAHIFWQPIISGPFHGRISPTTPWGYHCTKFTVFSSIGTVFPSMQRAFPAKYSKASTHISASKYSTPA